MDNTPIIGSLGPLKPISGINKDEKKDNNIDPKKEPIPDNNTEKDQVNVDTTNTKTDVVKNHKFLEDPQKLFEKSLEFKAQTTIDKISNRNDVPTDAKENLKTALYYILNPHSIMSIMPMFPPPSIRSAQSLLKGALNRTDIPQDVKNEIKELLNKIDKDYPPEKNEEKPKIELVPIDRLPGIPDINKPERTNIEDILKNGIQELLKRNDIPEEVRNSLIHTMFTLNMTRVVMSILPMDPPIDQTAMKIFLVKQDLTSILNTQGLPEDAKMKIQNFIKQIDQAYPPEK